MAALATGNIGKTNNSNSLINNYTPELIIFTVLFLTRDAIIPVIQWFCADRIEVHHAFVLPVLCYLFIAYYGVKRHIPQYIKSVKAK